MAHDEGEACGLAKAVDPLDGSLGIVCRCNPRTTYDRLIKSRWCGWCGCADLCNHPVKNKGPKLKWRRAEGAECGICPWVIQGNQDLRERRATGSLKSELASNANNTNGKFLAQRSAYVERHNQGQRAKRQSNVHMQVQAANFTGLSARKRLGWFLPASVYKARHNEFPKKSELSMYPVDGKPTKGILYKADPQDLECYELFSDSGSSVKQLATLADTAHQEREAVATAFETGARRFKLGTKEKKAAKDPNILTATVPAGRKRQIDDSDDDEAILDDIFGKAKFAVGAGKGSGKRSGSTDGGAAADDGSAAPESAPGGRCNTKNTQT